MWRCDAGRGGASSQELARELHLQWVRQLPPQSRAWPDQAKLTFDRSYEPVVVGQTMLVASSLTDSVTAYDTRSGREQWTFFAEGPVRLPPVAHEGRAYFASDDGYLYCVDVQEGTLVWKFRGGPSDRKVLGNGRLISTWPARGGPVIADGTVYFTASIWPFMGVFVHALDAETGQFRWTNDGDGSMYIKQPHNSDSFAGAAPQGALLVSGDVLVVPSGRSVPACYDRHTGKFLYYRLAENGKRGGGSEVHGAGPLFVNGGQMFAAADGEALGPLSGPSAFDGGRLYSFTKGAYQGSAGLKVMEKAGLDRKGNLIKYKQAVLDDPWFTCEAAGGDVLIKSGSRLYGGGKDTIVAVEIPPEAEKPAEAHVVWQTTVEGQLTSLLSADERLFAVTLEGRIYCFGPDKHSTSSGTGVPPVQVDRGNGVPPVQVGSGTGVPPVVSAQPLDQHRRDADATSRLLDHTDIREGYAVLWGLDDGEMLLDLIQHTRLHVVGIDPDRGRVAQLRRTLHASGLYGQRAALLVGNAESVEVPPYLASLMICGDPAAADITAQRVSLERLYQALRPYGGVACLDLPSDAAQPFRAAIEKSQLPQALVATRENWLMLTREGALPGSANWTHEHADAANTRVSKDQLVKAPLGLLWFGGPTNESILPRHGHGPQPQVVDGRAIVEGPDLLRAIDIYTGRLLWERNLPGFGEIYNNTGHHPGANGTGTNFISLSDGIYAIHGEVCLRLDPATGRTQSEFRLPRPGMDDPAARSSGTGVSPVQHRRDAGATALADRSTNPEDREDKAAPREWTYLNVAGDYLIGGADVTQFDAASAYKAGYEARIGSKELWVLNRHSGKVLWSITAQHEFRNNAICAGAGRLYWIDLLSQSELDRLKRRGEQPQGSSRLSVHDLATGKLLWETEQDVFGTWLSYSAEHDVLIESGRPGRDVLKDEPKGMRAFRGSDGTQLWKEGHAGPAILHGEQILLTGSACELLTGKPVMRDDPVTGQSVPWTWARNYGCNTPQASQHLMVFRSGAAGYYDLACDGGTGNFGGFRSSCTNNLIVAGGVLTAPDYTRTCTCSYQNQSSIGLVHMPEAEMWTKFTSESSGPIRQLAFNLGAPGSRRDPQGRLWWHEYPNVQVEFEQFGDYAVHSSRVSGAELPWVAASGCRGITEIQVNPRLERETSARFAVRLHFCDPDNDLPGQRVFDVSIQDREVLSRFDVVAESGGRDRHVIKEFRGIAVDDKLLVRFHRDGELTPASAPLLCGIEVVREN
jgi:outer membrane protein assembly factor BamB